MTATLGTKQYTGTCGSNGKCALTVNYAGTYSVTATKSGVSSSTASAAVSTSGGSYTATVKFCTLTVTIDSGSTVKAVNGSTTLGYQQRNGKVLPAEHRHVERHRHQERRDCHRQRCLQLLHRLYAGAVLCQGLRRLLELQCAVDGADALKKATDPNGLVNVDITTNPAPAVGTGALSSLPSTTISVGWHGQYNIINAVSYKKGQSGFSRSSYDTVVFIPEYYFRIIDDAANKKRYFYIADKAKSGFTKHPGSGKYVGRYNTISGHYSKTGAAPMVSRPAHRLVPVPEVVSGQYDFVLVRGLAALFGGVFRLGRQSKNRARLCRQQQLCHFFRRHGQHDLPHRTRSWDERKDQYRHIENPYGNVFEWIDGINYDGTVYVCLNPASYADDTATNYTNIGSKIQSDGYITAIGVASAMPWAFYPTAVGGSETTYIPDYAGYSSGWRVLFVGGYWSFGGNAGLFCFNAGNSSSDSYSYVGARDSFPPNGGPGARSPRASTAAPAGGIA